MKTSYLFLFFLLPYTSNATEPSITLSNACIELKSKLLDLQKTLATLKKPITLPKKSWPLPTGHSVLVTFDQEKKEYRGEIKDKNMQNAGTIVCPVQEKEIVFYDWLVYRGSISNENRETPSYWSRYAEINLYTNKTDNSWLIGGGPLVEPGKTPEPAIPLEFVTESILKRHKQRQSQVSHHAARSLSLDQYLNTYQFKNFWMNKAADDAPLPNDIQLKVKAFIEILWPIAQGKEPSPTSS